MSAAAYLVEDDEPRLGTYRKSMASNVQLIKDQIGLTRQSIFKLPPQDHTYGIKSRRKDVEHTRDVLTGWNSHQRRADEMQPKDFVATNRGSAINGIISAKDIREYHKTNDLRLRGGRKNVVGATTVNKSMTFGLQYERETPIANLIYNVYQHEHIKKNSASETNDKAVNKKKIIHTKASRGHQKNTNKGEPRELWKLTRFKNVDSRIDYTWETK